MKTIKCGWCEDPVESAEAFIGPKGESICDPCFANGGPEWKVRKAIKGQLDEDPQAGLILKPGGTTPERAVPRNGKKFTLAEMQAMVNGYPRELRLGQGFSMLVNEEGKVLGLSQNEMASAVSGDEIVGPTLVCKRTLLS